ncbi:MAG: oxygenase MpaB family protein [Actinomycetota bacterium]|nr:oxygenase MpaB family protein [Actinomycetota bacterium]
MVADVETPVVPRRFRGAPERNERIARPLRLVAGVRRRDPALTALLGRRMLARDEPAAELVAAMRRDRGDPERVTVRQVQTALEHGIGAVDNAPEALRRFLAVVEDTPDWVDWDLVERGARAMRRLGRTRDDVLLALSLIGGYRYGGPADLLVETGGLGGSTAIRRLAETQTWALAVGRPGGLRRDGEGFRLTVHVRVMHALVNDRFEHNGRWDSSRWGLPINRSDMATTLGLFNSTLLLGSRLLGRVVTPAESRAVMHAWRYVGWLMGVDDDWLFATERAQNAFNYHALCVQDDVTPAGPALAGALVDGEAERVGGRGGRRERRRLLALLRWFTGSEGLRDLGLPRVPVWTLAPTIARNVVESALVARVPAGRRWLERRGDRVAEALLASRLAGMPRSVADLPT